MIKFLVLFFLSQSAFAGTVAADRYLANVGTTLIPSFYVSTGGGNAGFYFGANGASFGYNGGEVSSFAASVWKFNVPIQANFAGSAGTPAFFLDADPNAGFWDIGLNHWGWSAASSKVLDMSAAGLGVTGTLNVSGTTTLNTGLTGVARADSGVVSAAELSGDGTTSGSNAFTLATVNSSPGSCTNCSMTVNGKGLVTAQSSGTAPVTSLTVATANGFAGSSSGGATPALTLTTTVNAPALAGNGTAVSAATTTGSGSTVVLATGPTMTNPVVGTQATGDNSTKAASTAFVQTALAQLNPAAAVYAASTATIAGTYTNAVGGVCIGDTFTTTALALFTLDGTSPPLNSRVLFKDQSSGFQNGVWTLTTQGVVGVSGAILTRALDWDSSADMNAGNLIPVINGTANASTVWFQTATISTCSSDSQVYTKFSGSGGSGTTNSAQISCVPSVADSNTQVLLDMEESPPQDFGGVAFPNSQPTWTLGGSTVTTVTQAKFGTHSLDSSSSSNGANTTSTSSNTLGSGDFTVDFWVYTGSGVRAGTYGLAGDDGGSASGQWGARVRSTGTVEWLKSGGTSVLITSSWAAVTADNTWVHFAFVRHTGTLNIYINGTSLGNVADATNYNSTANTLNVGYRPAGNENLGGGGFIDEFRISNIARWTSNFTPPSSAYATNAQTASATYNPGSWVTSVTFNSTGNCTVGYSSSAARVCNCSPVSASFGACQMTSDPSSSAATFIRGIGGTLTNGDTSLICQ